VHNDNYNNNTIPFRFVRNNAGSSSTPRRSRWPTTTRTVVSAEPGADTPTRIAYWAPAAPQSSRISGGETATARDTSPDISTASAGQPVDHPAARNASSATMPNDWLVVDRRTRLDPRLARWLLLFVSISPVFSRPFICRRVLSSNLLPPGFRSSANDKTLIVYAPALRHRAPVAVCSFYASTIGRERFSGNSVFVLNTTSACQRIRCFQTFD